MSTLDTLRWDAGHPTITETDWNRLLRFLQRGGIIKTASYIVWTDGTTIRAINGETGDVDYQGTVASTVIQSAWDAVGVLGGGLIHLRLGTYNLTATITDNGYDNIILEGEGRYTILNTTTNIVAISMTGTALAYLENITIRDLTVNGSGGGNAANLGIYFAYVNYCEVKGCLLTNCGGIAAFDCAYMEYSVIDDNWVIDNVSNGIGLAEGSYYNSVSRNKVHTHALNGIDLNGVAAPCEHNLVNDNVVVDTLVGVDLDTADDNIIEDNVLISNQLGVGLEGAGGSNDNLVIGNSISECHGGGGASAHGIQITNANCSRNDVIANKIFANTDGQGILTAGAYSLISANICYNNLNGIMVTGDNNTIEGNALDDNSERGLRIDGGNDNWVANNTMANNTSEGILLFNNADTNLITGNRTYGNSDCVLIFANTENNNRLWGNNFDEGAIDDSGTGTIAFDNFDPSAGVWIASIAAPAGGR